MSNNQSLRAAHHSHYIERSGWVLRDLGVASCGGGKTPRAANFSEVGGGGQSFAAAAARWRGERCIERWWREARERVLDPFMAWGYALEQLNLLNPDDPIDVVCVQLAVLERMDYQLFMLMQAHDCRTIHCRGKPDLIFGDTSMPQVQFQRLFVEAQELASWDHDMLSPQQAQQRWARALVACPGGPLYGSDWRAWYLDLRGASIVPFSCGGQSTWPPGDAPLRRTVMQVGRGLRRRQIVNARNIVGCRGQMFPPPRMAPASHLCTQVRKYGVGRGTDAVTALRNLAFRFAHAAGLRPELEKPGLLRPRPVLGVLPEDGARREGALGAAGRRPADVFLPCWRAGRPAALDFAVTSGLRMGSLALSAADGSAAVEAYAARKRDHLDTAAHCDEAGIDFIPMIVEASGGGWGSDSRRVWHELAHAAARLTGDPAPTKLEQLYQSLSVTLHRANARAILVRAPVPCNSLPAVAAAQAVLAGAVADQAAGNMILGGQ
eukprot:gene17874-biopygen36351